MQAQTKCFAIFSKLIKYTFSALSVCFNCVGPLPRSKTSFFPIINLCR